MKYYFYITWVMLMIATNVFAQGHNTKDYEGKTFQMPFVHDPVMAVENGITYIYATGAGIDELSSADGINYKAEGSVLKNIPAVAILKIVKIAIPCAIYALGHKRIGKKNGSNK